MQTATSRMFINRKEAAGGDPALSERTIFNMEQRGEFPRRIALTSRNVTWGLAEVVEWIEARKGVGQPSRAPASIQRSQPPIFSG